MHSVFKKRKKLLVIISILLLLYLIFNLLNYNKNLNRYVREDTEQTLDNLLRCLQDNRVRIVKIKHSNKISKSDIDFLYDRHCDIDKAILDLQAKYKYISDWKEKEVEVLSKYDRFLWEGTKATFKIYDNLEMRFKNNESLSIELDEADIEELNYIFKFYLEFEQKVLEFKDKLI